MTDLLHQAVLGFNAFVIVYMLGQYANQLALTCLGWREISEYVKRRQLRDYETIARSELSVPVSLIVPAYNEEEVILESVRSLLRSHYATFEVVVVNDGSTDRTLEVLLDEYELMPDLRVPRARVESKPVVGSYRSLRDERLVVIDKENGGSRADAMNAGLQYARYPLFLAVDADTLLDVDALPRLVREFQVRPETVALGGIVRIANGSTVEAGHVTEARTPRELLVNLQIIEYLRAFLVGRTGWSRIGAILIVSGRSGSSAGKRSSRQAATTPTASPRTPSSCSGCTASAAIAAGRTGSASSPTRCAGRRRRRRSHRCARNESAGSAACCRCCGATATCWAAAATGRSACSPSRTSSRSRRSARSSR
jgi:Glycosyl transferase family 2